MSGFVMLISVAFVAVLTMSATSVRAVSRLWLRHWIERRTGGVGVMARYLERPTRLVHAAGTAAMLMIFSTGAWLAMAHGLDAWSFIPRVLVFLILLLVAGQVLPRAIARRWAAVLVPITVPLLRVVDLVLTPFHLVSHAVRRFVARPSRAGVDEEVRDGLEELMRDGTFADIGTTEEMAIISGVMQFGDKVARDVMTPRRDMFMLRDGLPAAEVAREVATAGYSRVPVYRESPDQVVGMIHVFDVFRRRGESLPTVRPVPFTTGDKPAKDLLFELLRSRRQLAIVRDGHTVIGMVTLEDLLEELVGDIRDEHDDSGE
ncbi:MAG: CBS domain-containing protein [Gemmatimonadaceae bacterium]|nr:CBS domain-containing protein [Gemmatimonadaceae bacterium]